MPRPSPSGTASLGGADEFRRRLIEGLGRDRRVYQRGNHDFWRYQVGSLGRLRSRARDVVLAALARAGLSRPGVGSSLDDLAYLFEHLDDYARTYERLSDDHSRELLLTLLRFRALGREHVRLPRNDAAYWAARASVDRTMRREGQPVRGPWNWPLHLYEATVAGTPVRVHADKLDVLNTFVLEQYAYRRGGRRIEVRAGDVVIDGGGCSGDTAMYLAARAGAEGRVFSFEFNPENLEVYERNRELNPQLTERIEVVQRALWDSSGEEITYAPDGAATSLVRARGDGRNVVATLAIDDLVAQRSLPRVDFIKFDIEGAELRGLRGAERTLRAHRPRLAVTVYHEPEDLFEIPDYLHGLGLGYEFFLDHFTIYGEETVLFAEAAR